MDVIFGIPADTYKNTGILVFVDRFSKMVHLISVTESINALACARFLSTRSSVFINYCVKSYRTEMRNSLLLSGSPCSKRLEHALRCRPLTILKQMVRRNVQIPLLRKSFGVTSIRLRSEASSYRWLNFPSTIRCTHRRRVFHSS